jgi:hypothetical protein
MIAMSPFPLLWFLVFLLLAAFYLSRILWYRQRMRSFDAENEVGHALMALGMAYMLAQPSGSPSNLLWWTIALFAAASLWWAVRLCLQKPISAFLLRQTGRPSQRQSDVFHLCTHAGMSYMFLLMGSMAFSMTLWARPVISLFALFFAFLTCFSGREIIRDFLLANRDWLQCGTDLAHALMSGVMCWMFLKMLLMTMSMHAL